MRKSGIFLLGAALSFTFLFCGTNTYSVSAETEQRIVYVGGMSAGFTLQSGHVQIVGICEVMTENGVRAPASNAGLRAGDRILKIGGKQVETVTNLNAIVNAACGKTLTIEYQRGEDIFSSNVQPAKDKTSGNYKIGILARDSISGIGTVTYIEKETGRFGALGHPVVNDNKQTLKISEGAVYACNIIGVSKGIRGRAGELRGMFLNDKPFGRADKLCDCGIFGEISKDFSFDKEKKTVASSLEAIPGKAYIYSTTDGACPKKYEIEIVKVDKYNKENKNYVIKITDDTLIEETGGIVQGMSGSPILQNNKLIGAVTHVFLNDPTRGYGIDIETMLKE